MKDFKILSAILVCVCIAFSVDLSAQSFQSASSLYKEGDVAKKILKTEYINANAAGHYGGLIEDIKSVEHVQTNTILIIHQRIHQDVRSVDTAVEDGFLYYKRLLQKFGVEPDRNSDPFFSDLEAKLKA